MVGARRPQRRGIRFGIEWIALNDEPDEIDARVIADQISVMLLADLFGKDPEDVADDIAQWRCRYARDTGNPGLTWFDQSGTLRNADGSRSIFDDVDE